MKNTKMHLFPCNIGYAYWYKKSIESIEKKVVLLSQYFKTNVSKGLMLTLKANFWMFQRLKTRSKSYM